jgi:hypothetical protein
VIASTLTIVFESLLLDLFTELVTSGQQTVNNSGGSALSFSDNFLLVGELLQGITRVLDLAVFLLIDEDGLVLNKSIGQEASGSSGFFGTEDNFGLLSSVFLTKMRLNQQNAQTHYYR